MTKNYCNVKPGSRGAFSLVELLVVIAVIAILAALSLVAFTAVNKSAASAKCVSNLRQVGIAMSTSMADHDGALPGPLWTWQSPWYDSGDYGSIGTVLAKYFSVQPTTSKQKADILICPAWQRGAPYQEDDLYVMNTKVDVGGTPTNPWGNADIVEKNGGVFGLDPAGLDTPKKTVALSGVSLSKTWAMQDLDKKLATVPQGPKWYGIAPTPVHGTFRNALFFDFHVAAIPAA